MITTMASALWELGANEDTLTQQERAQLDRDGYLMMGQLLSSDDVRSMRARLDALVVEEGEDAGKDFLQEEGAVSLGTLVNKAPSFDVCFLHPRVLAAVAHQMGDDFGLSSLAVRTPLPGRGHQELHRDSSEPCVNALWMLNDFTEHNGATRVVPGSHRLGGKTPEELGVDSLASHPDEVQLIGPAGTLVVMNGWTWHSGTLNRSGEPRYLVSAIFMRRGRYQARAYRRLLPATRARFNEASLYVLDHEGS